MLTGLYHAASALNSAERQHEVISQNLAHAQMPGYRRLVAQSGKGSFEAELESAQAGNGRVAVDFTPGPIARTDHPLDVAIQGDGFFAVEGPKQQTLYTRNGTFRLSEDHHLQTVDGFNVLDEGGRPIEIPENTAIRTLTITEDGSIRAGTQNVAKLKLVDFEHREKLQQAGITLFSAPDSAQVKDVQPALLQNYREGSNVAPVLELVSMIEAQRRYESAQKSITLLSDSVRRHIDQK